MNHMMTETNDRRLPVGIQSFETIRKEGYLYVDKTDIIWQLANRGKKYNYLSRPRRFGKSVLVDTLQAYFEGKKELFEGLKIMDLEKEWKHYPVIRLDMSRGGANAGTLRSYLNLRFKEYENLYGITPDPTARLADRFHGILSAANKKTGLQVAILIDEYDSPLQHSWKTPQHDECTEVYREVFAILKADDEMECFVFITGITKFSQLSIFSELNNITNISMDEAYAGICGITKEELLTQMSDDIDRLAEKLSVTREEAILQLTDNYDGYHFTYPSPDIFNPYSLLNCFSKEKIGAYWFGSGTPTFLIEMMRKFDVKASDIVEGIEADKTEFDAPTECLETITPLLYQSGYLTIKNYNKETDLYTLDIPNKEIRVGLYRSLLPRFENE